MTHDQRRAVALLVRRLKGDLAARGVEVRVGVDHRRRELHVEIAYTPAGQSAEDVRALAAEVVRRIGDAYVAGGKVRPRLGGPVEYVDAIGE